MRLRTVTNKNLLFIFLSFLLLGSCSPKSNTFNVDLSNLPRPKTNKPADEDKKEITPVDKIFIKDLLPFKNKEQLLSEFKFGKKDPFALDDNQVNQFKLDFKLNGFLNTKDKKFVFVNYLGKAGTISEKSIGGLNTNLLPNGAKVMDIDTEKMKLTINFDNEDFIFEL